MKKIVFGVIAVMLALSLNGCGKSDPAGPEPINYSVQVIVVGALMENSGYTTTDGWADFVIFKVIRLNQSAESLLNTICYIDGDAVGGILTQKADTVIVTGDITLERNHAYNLSIAIGTETITGSVTTPLTMGVQITNPPESYMTLYRGSALDLAWSVSGTAAQVTRIELYDDHDHEYSNNLAGTATSYVLVSDTFVPFTSPVDIFVWQYNTGTLSGSHLSSDSYIYGGVGHCIQLGLL
jgi:hypothetical protein